MRSALVRATTIGIVAWFAIWRITMPSTSHAPPWQYAPLAWLVAVSCDSGAGSFVAQTVTPPAEPRRVTSDK
jgi:hypothetical protein